MKNIRGIKNFAIFGNMRHNLVVLDAFAEVMKVTYHTWLWDTNLTWYSASATHWILPL